MIYRYMTPSPALQEFVRDYLIAHFVFDNHQPIPVKAFAPRPEQAIAFLPKGHLIMRNLLHEQTQLAPSASICGQQLSRYNFHLTREYLMFRVNFHPGALYRLLRIPLSEFIDTWFDAGLAINREMAEVNERLANTQGYSDMVNIVEGFLTAKIKRVKLDSHPLDKVASNILTTSAKVSLDWLAGQACLCQRQFNRKFQERIGVTPKLYSRIVRFFNTYKYKEAHPHEDWLNVALMFGYTDYQHLVKDFKTFANVTPNVWVNQDTQSPERMLHLA
jgi:AraC-like DNA-binding protein